MHLRTEQQFEDRSPLLERRGGYAIKKCREASETAQTGWSLTTKGLVSDHPVRSSKGGFASFFLVSRPLLTKEGT